MNRFTCDAAIPAETLEGYWLGEIDAGAQASVEEHLFACARCNSRLQALVDLGAAIRAVTREGGTHAVIGASFLGKLRDDGMKIREYRLGPGGSVACTIAPEDDLVVSRLEAPLHGVRRLDMVFHDTRLSTPMRLEDVAFDSQSGEVLLAHNTPFLRSMGKATNYTQLFAVDEQGERELGRYTFNHTPWPGSQGS